MEVDPNAEVDAQVAAFLAAWFRTRQTVMEANFHRAHQQGLSTTQFMVLNLVEREGPWTLRTLATTLNLESTSLIQTVDSLEQRGLVTRQRSTTDRRQVHILLSAAGRTAQQASQLQFHTRLAAIFQAMPPAARHALVTGLAAFADAATTPQKEAPHATD